MRKYYAIASAVIVAAICAAVALAWPNTTSGEVTGQPVCNTETGQFEGKFEVTWTVTQNADPGWTITKTQPDSPAVVEYNANKAGDEVSFTFKLTQERPKQNGNGTEKQSADFTGKLTLPTLGDCQKEERKITICHASPPGNGNSGPAKSYELITVDENGLNGHGSHPNDIIPALQGEGGYYCPTVEEPPTEVTPAGPQFTDPTCSAEAGLVIPETQGVTYAVEGTVAAGETVTVTASANEGYVFAEGAQTEWSYTFGDKPTNCTPPPPNNDVKVYPGVEFKDPTCDTSAAVIPTATEGITYKVEGDVAPGSTVTVTASANPGYTIRGNNTWTYTFGKAPENCVTVVTPPVTPEQPPVTPDEPEQPVEQPVVQPVPSAPKPSAPVAQPNTEPQAAPETR